MSTETLDHDVAALEIGRSILRLLEHVEMFETPEGAMHLQINGTDVCITVTTGRTARARIQIALSKSIATFDPNTGERL